MLRSIAMLCVLAALPPLASPARGADATLAITFTNNGEPLPDPTLARFYVFEPEKRDQYLAWGHGDKVARVPEGTYDVVVKYHNDQIHEERVFELVDLYGHVQQEIDFTIPVATLNLQVTVGGEPVPSHAARYSLYPASRRGKPLVSRRPGESVTIRPGVYDVEVVYHDQRGLQSTWLEFYALAGELEEVVDFGRPSVEFGLTFYEDGRETQRGRWRVFETGQRDEALTGGKRPGESVELPVGVYDIRLTYRQGGRNVERWLESVPVRETEQRVVDIDAPVAQLRVEVRRDGSELSGAWFGVYPAGDPETVVASGVSGTAVELDAGIYDLGFFYRKDGVLARQWLRGQSILDRVERTVDLEFETASLQVTPKRHSREPSNLLLLVDSSAAMAADLGRDDKLGVLRAGIHSAAAGLRGSGLRVGLRAFGTAEASRRDCRDSTLLLPLGEPSEAGLTSTVDRLQPGGSAPISYSLDLGATDLPPDGNNALLLITGGTENCGRDPCAMASRLLRRGNVDRVYVVGLGIPRDQQHELSCIGEFHNVSGRAQLRTTLQEILREFADNDAGTLSVFEPDGGDWVVSGPLGETLQVAAGTYDLLINTAGRSYSWPNVGIRGEFESPVGTRPSR